MRLGELIEGCGVEVRDGAVSDWRDVRICDLTEDSRTVLPGSLFVARPGVRTDGRKFIEQAVASDAAAILTTDDTPPPLHLGACAWLTARDLARAEALVAERYFGSPSRRLTLIGVTGTNGKTTVSHLVYQLLNLGGGVRGSRRRCGLIGTVTIDDGGRVAKASLTTPPAIELSYTLAKMVENGCAAAAMEVSSHALAQQRAAGLEFAVAVFTNLTGDHLDYHGTMEAYAEAKSRLFSRLRPEATAIVNADDAAHRTMLGGCRARVLRCTMDSRAEAHCRATIVRMSTEGSHVALTGPWGEIEGHTRLIGPYNAMNLLQAVTAAYVAGLSRDTMALALYHLTAPPGRLELVSRSASAEPFAVFVDYAHTDDALEKSLAALRPLTRETGGRLRVVFGCGGDRDRTKRPRMARVATTLADEVIITSDNPRSEKPHSIISDILSGIEAAGPRAAVHVDADRAAAIAHAIESANPGDVVLIAGKGHEDYQLVSDGAGGITRLDFDDRVVARAALAARFGWADSRVRAEALP